MAQGAVVTEERLAHILDAAARHVTVTAAYLYGSQLTGATDEWSDIDLALFCPEAESWSTWQRIDVESAIEREVGRDVEIRLYSDRWLEEVQHRPASFAAYILRNGRRLA